jgi:hypothetical protein
LVKDVFLTHILLVISSFMPTNRSSRNYPPRPHHQFTAPRIAVASSEKTATNPKAWRRPAAVPRQWVPKDPVGPHQVPSGPLACASSAPLLCLGQGISFLTWPSLSSLPLSLRLRRHRTEPHVGAARPHGFESREVGILNHDPIKINCLHLASITWISCCAVLSWYLSPRLLLMAPWMFRLSQARQGNWTRTSREQAENEMAGPNTLEAVRLHVLHL